MGHLKCHQVFNKWNDISIVLADLATGAVPCVGCQTDILSAPFRGHFVLIGMALYVLGIHVEVWGWGECPSEMRWDEIKQGCPTKSLSVKYPTGFSRTRTRRLSRHSSIASSYIHAALLDWSVKSGTSELRDQRPADVRSGHVHVMCTVPQQKAYRGHPRTSRVAVLRSSCAALWLVHTCPRSLKTREASDKYIQVL